MWFKDLKIRPESINLEEILGEKLHDIGLGSDFLNMTPKAQVPKAVIDKRDYIKLKSFYTVKKTSNRVKTRHTKWEGIFFNGFRIFRSTLHYQRPRAH